MDNTVKALPKSVEELKSQGEGVLLLEDGDIQFYFRKPKAMEAVYFLDKLSKETALTKAKEKFIRSLFVGDNVSQLDKFLAEKPFAYEKIIFILTKDLGSNVNFTVAKM